MCCLNENDWDAVRKDIALRPVSIKGKDIVVDGNSSEEDILNVLAHYGIRPDSVTLWGTGAPLREFLWSEVMADASVHVLLNVDFKDVLEKSDFVVNHDGIKEVRNCHINVGTGKQLTIKECAEKIKAEIGFKGKLLWNVDKPDGTMKKLTDVSKLHRLGWHHKIEIDEGIHRLYEWYKQGICINHQSHHTERDVRRALHLFLKPLCYLSEKVVACVASVDAMIAVGIGLHLKVLVGLNQRFGIFCCVTEMDIIVGKAVTNKQIAIQ